MAVMPYWLPMAIIGVTAAKVQPCIRGRRTPKRQKPSGLDQGGDAGHEEIGADQVRKIARGELAGLHQCPTDDQRHGYRAGVHGQDVLQTQRREPGQGWDLVDGVLGRHRGLDCAHGSPR